MRVFQSVGPRGCPPWVVRACFGESIFRLNPASEQGAANLAGGAGDSDANRVFHGVSPTDARTAILPEPWLAANQAVLSRRLPTGNSSGGERGVASPTNLSFLLSPGIDPTFASQVIHVNIGVTLIPLIRD